MFSNFVSICPYSNDNGSADFMAATGASLLASLDGVNRLAELLNGNESRNSSSVSKSDLQSWISTGADWERFGRRARIRELRGST
jgi:hypothetical protein